MSNYLITPWNVETDPVRVRRFSKFAEELGELQAVVARCISQGIDEIDPSSGKTNRHRLTEEIADVRAQALCTIKALNLDEILITIRTVDKIKGMQDWEAAFVTAPDPGIYRVFNEKGKLVYVRFIGVAINECYETLKDAVKFEDPISFKISSLPLNSKLVQRF
jgi:NTP pyrophosphatase (non-canonical NTP hydrolase)